MFEELARTCVFGIGNEAVDLFILLFVVDEPISVLFRNERGVAAEVISVS